MDRDHKQEKEKEIMTGTEQGQGDMSEEQSKSTAPSGPRWPTSVSALQAQSQQDGQKGDNPDPIREGHSQPMIPAGDNPDPVRRGYSQPMIPSGSDSTPLDSKSWKTLPAHHSAHGQQGDGEYNPKMAGGGVMPVVKPPGEARNEEARAKIEQERKRKEECEDCQ